MLRAEYHGRVVGGAFLFRPLAGGLVSVGVPDQSLTAASGGGRRPAGCDRGVDDALVAIMHRDCSTGRPPAPL
jgi:hypothetical protein